jgi:Mg/Co/Ni transporter MgtE
MLVGAGGNAGNQSAVMVIRGMALGEITDFSICKTEAMKAGIIGVMMFFAGYVRVYLFQQEVLPSLAVACAQFMIVVTSIGEMTLHTL